ncbi:putative reverse transcriptase domain-containing protein [Tanacetum coccineum]|uniref:Reverse transcriptase domain-containing protein n=1 Tax=Tanacetum coccineum TaxID=301880 RepID=A0ABQ5EAI6_9ASTR
MELEDHVPVYIPEPKHPEDLVPAEDEAPIEAYIIEVASAPMPPLPPPSFLPSLIRPPRTRAAMAQIRATSPSTYHPLLPSGTPPLLPIPLPTPSTSRRADIPEADTPPRKRLLLTAPRPRGEVGESSAAAARQPRPTMARRVDYSFVDTVETRKDRAAMRAEIKILRRERIAYEQESIETLDDHAVEHIMRTQALEAGARVDTLEDTASRRTMAAVNQGMSVEEIEQIVAQRVTNAIETIAIYEAQTNMARKSLNQAKHQEDKVSGNTSNKRKWEGDQNGSPNQQQNKEHKMFRAHAVGPNNKKEYLGSLPLCKKCKFHHNGPCTVKCGNCKKVGHVTRDCRNPAAARNQRTLTWLSSYDYWLGSSYTNHECSDWSIETRESSTRGRRRYVRPFKVLKHVRFVAYKLKLPQELSRVHSTFHVSNLKKCYADEPLAVPLDGLHLDVKLHFVEKPVEIIDREVKWLKRSLISLVKVQWNSKQGPEFTWEREDQFRKKYPHLFAKTAPSTSTAS